MCSFLDHLKKCRNNLDKYIHRTNLETSDEWDMLEILYSLVEIIWSYERGEYDNENNETGAETDTETVEEVDEEEQTIQEDVIPIKSGEEAERYWEHVLNGMPLPTSECDCKRNKQQL